MNIRSKHTLAKGLFSGGGGGGNTHGNCMFASAEQVYVYRSFPGDNRHFT